MSPVHLGLAVAALTALLWQIGALPPWHPNPPTSLDLHWYFFPTYDAFFGALRAGTPILWNPYQFCGMPWLGTLQGGFFYPPHLLYMVLPVPWALALSTVGHLAFAAACTAAFARRAGLSSAGATLAAAVFAFVGAFRTMQLWPYLLESVAWLPFGALAVLHLSGGEARRGTVLLTLASGMSWLAGCPQGTLFAVYTWGALLIARLLAARSQGAALARPLGGFALGLTAGVLLAAVALLPGAEMAREGMRRGSTLDVEVMFPFGVTPPGMVWRHWLATGSPVLLLTALGLAPLALLSGSHALVLWGFVVGGAATAFTLGPATPLFRLYLVLPLLGWFRSPERLLLVSQFALAILAGLGLDVAARHLRWRYAAPVTVLVLLAAVTIEGMRRPAIVPPLPYRAGLAPYSPAQREAYAGLAAAIGDARVWPFSPGLMHYALPPKLPTLTRLHSIDDYEPLPLRRQRDYLLFFSEGSLPQQGRRSEAISVRPRLGQLPAATRRRLLDLAAVRFVIVRPQTKRQRDVTAFVRDAGLEPRPPLEPAMELFENPHVLPRAFVTYRASPAPPPAELLPILARESFDPLVESWVEGDAGLPPVGDARTRGAPARIVRDDPQLVEVEATLAAPGLVVLADTFYPGWTATVDGTPAPILPTNYLFRGVPAPAGAHRVRFEYRSRPLALGALLSLAAVLGLAVAARRSGRR